MCIIVLCGVYYCLWFNNAVSSSDCAVLIGAMIGE
jgi:hypothetical protein